MTEEQLTAIIASLVKRKWDVSTSDAEVEFIDRVLNGLRYKYELAGPIWEGLDDLLGRYSPVGCSGPPCSAALPPISAVAT